MDWSRLDNILFTYSTGFFNPLYASVFLLFQRFPLENFKIERLSDVFRGIERKHWAGEGVAIGLASG